MDWLAITLRHHPELAVFLTLALGYWIGALKIGSFSIGPVTGVLIVGLLIGQMRIAISPNVEALFFLMFLFATGYKVGPQFFRGLKHDGIRQALFAVILAIVCLLTAYGAAVVAGMDAGSAAGLLSGASTISSVIGVSTDTLNQLAISPEQKAHLISQITIAFAVTFIFGTAGTAWFLSVIGPRILGVDLAEECRKLEQSMGESPEYEAGVTSAYRRFSTRAYRVENPEFTHDTIADFEARFHADRIVVERIRREGSLIEPGPSTGIHDGDLLAISGRTSGLLVSGPRIGAEIDDMQLLDFPVETLDVVITSKALAGKSIGELGALPFTHGTVLRKLIRSGHEMPFIAGTKIDRGDVLQILGARHDVERAAKMLGYADRATNTTDMVFVGAGIVLGGMIGALSVHAGRIPLSLSTSGGALIAGLLFGWLRSVHRTFGRVPDPALWILDSVGLNTFIASIAITSAPLFVQGLRRSGIELFIAGVIVTLVPMVIGILMGKYLFRMHPAIVLGACAGTRTATPALAAIQDVAGSKVPALGYTVTYAIGNTLLTIWGVVIVALMS
ncbi:MAG TPA: aspartate-alanine antiporter [Candidatus Binatus sp.]|nr:aspartate-alanine antiporter [Candidatus Binatus sp.]